jgi:MFS family permease
MKKGVALVAWVLAAVYYFYQYALRSAPSVMMPQLSEAFGIGAAVLTSVLGLFYYGYAAFSVVAGATIDRIGARMVIPAGALMTALGAILFGTGNLAAASCGRFLQGSGGVFALVGAVYIASKHFPSSHVATLIGATQMFGMAGGAAGQFAVGPLIAEGVSWKTFWVVMGLAGLVMATMLALVLPKEDVQTSEGDWLKGSLTALSFVFRNPQSILCGLIAALIFIPTTIFDMVWGVRFMQEAHGFPYEEAVIRSATVPLGWIIGCPLLGLLSDRLGRRKPVIIAGACVLLLALAWILYGPAGVFPSYVLGLIAGGSSGAAMLLYTVIKEANPPQYGGTATGVINLLNFAFSALVGPVFGWVMQNISVAEAPDLKHYQTTFSPILWGVAAAAGLTFWLKETGPAVRVPAEMAETV